MLSRFAAQLGNHRGINGLVNTASIPMGRRPGAGTGSVVIRWHSPSSSVKPSARHAVQGDRPNRRIKYQLATVVLRERHEMA